MRAALRSAAAGLILAGTIVSALAQTRLVGTFNSWSLFAHGAPSASLCFLSSPPQSSEPAGARRDPIFFYISAWPRDGVRTEVSVKIGYPFKKGTDATVTIGAESFKLFTQDERAWIDDPFDELKLIEAMKKGATMLVQGQSERGTMTKDTYSLTGLSRAMQGLTTSCN